MSALRFTLCAPASHASLPGHFPGDPIVPGVVLLDLLIAAFPAGTQLVAISSAKFLQAVRPEEKVDVTVTLDEPIEGRQRARAVAVRGADAVLEASFILSVSPS